MVIWEYIIITVYSKWPISLDEKELTKIALENKDMW